MPFIDDRDKAIIRNAMEETLFDSAVIYRNTPLSDGAGGESDHWSSIGTLPCRVSAVRIPSEASIAGAVQGQQHVQIVFAHGTDVTRNDRLLVNGADNYEVAGIIPGGVDCGVFIEAVKVS